MRHEQISRLATYTPPAATSKRKIDSMASILKFKTNINCSNCVAAVRPHLDTLTDVSNWEVDLADKDRILTVQLAGDTAAQRVSDVLKTAGYSAELFEER